MNRNEILVILGVIVVILILSVIQKPTPVTTTTTSITTTTIAGVITTTTIETTTTITVTTTTTVSGTTSPRILSAEVSPKSVKVGKDLTFTANVSDAKSDFVQVSFCKEITCSFKYCMKTDYASPSGNKISCTFTPTVVIVGTNQFWAVAKKAGASSETIGPFNFTVTYT